MDGSIPTPPGGGDKGVQVRRGGNIHHSEAERGRALHYDTAKYKIMRGGRLMARNIGLKVVMGSGGDKPGRSVGGGGGNGRIYGRYGGRGGGGTKGLRRYDSVATTYH